MTKIESDNLSVYKIVLLIRYKSFGLISDILSANHHASILSDIRSVAVSLQVRRHLF